MVDIIGTSNRDRLIGTIVNDTINGLGDTDRLEGHEGDDILYGGEGDDQGFTFFPNTNNFANAGLYGGAGNDTLQGEAGDDSLFGEDGDDVLFGGAGKDVLDGGAGDDYLDAGTEVEQIVGGAGVDALCLDFREFSFAVTVSYTDVDGTAFSEPPSYPVDAVNSPEALLIPPVKETAISFNSVESLIVTGGLADDLIDVRAASANSWIVGGAGNDIIRSGSGQDRLEGNDGDDILWAGSGDDSGLQAFPGHAELVNAGLYGGAGNDTLFGAASDDNVEGPLLPPFIEDGNNHLFGEDGDDNLYGGAGNDLLNGGANNDNLTGGLGADHFVFETDTAFERHVIGVDAITDFDSTQLDKIILDKTTFSTLKSAVGEGFTEVAEFEAVNSDAAATISTASIVYNASNGKLFYNYNGSATGFGALAGGQFATLTGQPTLTGSDFIIQA